MAQPSPDAEWSLAVIGGVFALLGVAVGHLLTMLAAWIDRKRRRNELLLSKLDDLTSEHRAIADWLSNIRHTRTLLDLHKCHPEARLSRIEALALLYFESLQQPVGQYTAALRSYYTWAIGQVPQLSRDGNLPHPLLWCLTLADKDSAERHHQEIELCHRSLAESVSIEAKRLLG